MRRREFLCSGVGAALGGSIVPAPAKAGADGDDRRSHSPSVSPVLGSYAAADHRRRLESIGVCEKGIRRCLHELIHHAHQISISMFYGQTTAILDPLNGLGQVRRNKVRELLGRKKSSAVEGVVAAHYHAVGAAGHVLGVDIEHTVKSPLSMSF